MLLVPFAVILAVCMLAVSYVDFHRLVIPNRLNAIVLVVGAAFKLLTGLEALALALLFGAFVFLMFWTLRYVYWRFRGVVGLGLGDVKFAGAAAVWLDPWSFPAFLFIASALALLYFCVIAKRTPDITLLRVPFGPFLALALFVTWNFNTFYSQAIG
ncbi:prepilin peptidase [Rhizobium sp. NLR9b]|uniref:prepilin peptidase n=1 Tax=unclassified Rhizobium TaxID=2613769 RepID=UPI001C83C413|nr:MULTISPECIES: A24 family peptidase [unclassified Rhizobium]MBX5230570.1 prepilin peptidase [Rhizobium sp. NLR9b]MBX5291238.1 prepilin peptidase [Rhizobium sp. NLR10b]